MFQVVGPILAPRSPEEIVHNVMLRQMADDAQNPPVQPSTTPALALLRKMQQMKDRGESLTPLQEELARVAQGQDIEDQVTQIAFRAHNNRQFGNYMLADEEMDAFLFRCYKRGDLTPTEAIVLKKMAMAQLEKCAENLQHGMEKGVTVNPADISKMDYTVQIQERTLAQQFAGTTPQGREIIRKITMKARRKIFKTEG